MSTIEPDATVPRRYTRAGDYDLIRKMGSGGFGVVFEARHRQTRLMYAVKRVELSAEDAERFRNEAEYPARIASQSLHVLGVHSFFHDPGEDVFYLVTELVPHGDLRKFLDNNPKPLPTVQALQVAIGIARGLAAIHAQGIIHRDLKPANVLMDRKDDQWVPKIADFGLARSTNSISKGEYASSGYSAPEQVDLLSDQPLGPESDLFSFGMLLYELLTGQKPTTARDLREYGRWIGTRQTPAAPSAVRAELAKWPQLDSLVASLLQFDRTKRANTAADVVKTLAHVLRKVEADLQPQSTRPETPKPERPAPKPEQRAKPERPAPDPEPTQSWPPERPTEIAPGEIAPGEWTRRRTLTYMAVVFAVTAVSMTLGIPWKDPSSKFALPEVPLPIFFGGAGSAPWYAKASWLALPALFGLAVALAVRLSWSRAAIVSVLSTVAYQLAVWAPFLIISAVQSIATANGATASGARDALLWLIPTIAGGLGALLVRLALAPWHRPSRLDLTLTTLVGVVTGGSFLAIGFIRSVEACFATWQVGVGLLIVDRILFKKTTTPAREWSLKPVMSVVAATILMIAVGTWARNLPVPLQPGKSEQNSKDQSSYVWIPPGEFRMGCAPDDSECGQDEQPLRTVTFTKGFWLGQTEVTVKTWKAAPGERTRPLSIGWGGLLHNVWDANPIASVTWTEARDYCSAMDGRLPTEAEWEYAARAGTNGARYGRLNEIAHYAENSGTSGTQSSNTAPLSDQALQEALIAKSNYATSPGTHGSNPWSLQDMLGNAAEWVEDDYADIAALRETARLPPAAAPEGFATMSPAMADMVAYPRYIYRQIEPALGRRIVEIGVGYGTYTKWLLERGEVLGSDIAQECLDAVRAKFLHTDTPRLRLARIDLCDETTIDASADFQGDSLICLNVLEHIPDDVAALAMMRRLLAPRGKLAIVVPAHPRLFGPMDAQAGHFRRYTRRTLAAALRAAGWTPQRTFYFNAVGAIGWWYHNRFRQAGLADEQVNTQMRTADKWLPRIARLTDPLTSRWMGLSVAAFAQRMDNEKTRYFGATERQSNRSKRRKRSSSVVSVFSVGSIQIGSGQDQS